MSQKTLTGGIRPLQAPFTSLSPNERIIYNFLNSMQRGLTHDHIKQSLQSTSISTFDNRLRGLRSKGWIISHKDKSGLLLWYAVPREAGG